MHYLNLRELENHSSIWFINIQHKNQDSSQLEMQFTRTVDYKLRLECELRTQEL